MFNKVNEKKIMYLLQNSHKLISTKLQGFAFNRHKLTNLISYSKTLLYVTVVTID